MHRFRYSNFFYMEIKRIIESLKQHKSEIIEILKANNWRHFRDYFLIKEKFLSNNLDDQFEKVFSRFYIMNGARGLNIQQKKEFFKSLLLRETDLEKILVLLYNTPGYKNSCKLFFSFGTKMLHTINEKLPIYDGNIAMFLNYLLRFTPFHLKKKLKIELIFTKC